MGDSERFTEDIASGSYTGMLADAYDVWLPPGVEFPDDVLYQRLIADAGGPALELGTGNGRFLVPARALGLDVSGVEQSVDMIAHCRRRAAEAGVDVVVRQGDIAPLTLDDRFRTIVCPAGTFSLIADLEAARSSLASYRRHLDPNGRLAMAGHTEAEPDGTRFHWRLRRTGTDPDTGVSYVAHEATGRDDTADDVQLVFNRVESYDSAGLLTATCFTRLRLRSWTREALTAELTRAGFGAIDIVGDATDWVVIATAA
jgi:SAM-dependent methyltransferase